MNIKNRIKLLLMSFIMVVVWYSCSKQDDDKTPAGYTEIFLKSGSEIEKTSQKFRFSHKDWENLTNKYPNINFRELKINDYGKQKEFVNEQSIEFPHSIKIIELVPKSNIKIQPVSAQNPETELTVVCIHGLGGKESDFYSLVDYLLKEYFDRKINIIVGKRYDSCFKSIEEQAKEVEIKLREYFNNFLPNKKQNVLIIGHSQGGIISLSLIDLLKDDNDIAIKGLILIGTPLQGIDSIINYLTQQKKEYPILVSLLQKSIFGCTFGKQPMGVFGTLSKNQEHIIKNANQIIKKNKIPTINLIGSKPKNFDYPNSCYSLVRQIKKFYKNGILHFKHKEHKTKVKSKKNNFFPIIREVCKGIYNIKKLFNAKNISGELNSDLLLSVKTQTWRYKNEYIKNKMIQNVVHNSKIGLLTSESNERIVSELESSQFFKEVKIMINKILQKSLSDMQVQVV